VEVRDPIWSQTKALSSRLALHYCALINDAFIFGCRFDLMWGCWLVDPDNRPTFSTLAETIQTFLDDSNYMARSSTSGIQSDYYLEPNKIDRGNFAELYYAEEEEEEGREAVNPA